MKTIKNKRQNKKYNVKCMESVWVSEWAWKLKINVVIVNINFEFKKSKCD